MQSDTDLALFLWKQHHFIVCKRNTRNPSFAFLTVLPVTPFSCPFPLAKHPWDLWIEALLAHLLDFRVPLQMWILLSQGTSAISEALRDKEWCHSSALSLALLRLCCSSTMWMMLFNLTGGLLLPGVKEMTPLRKNYAGCVSYQSIACTNIQVILIQ